jgi:hypothetical protein
MRVLARLIVTFALCLGGLGALASPALGCSIAGAQIPLEIHIADASSGTIQGGVFEQETIAWAPSILIRNAASASVVTRVWGQPPANTGIQFDGGYWLPFLRQWGDSCKGVVDPNGHVILDRGRTGSLGYGYAPPPESGGEHLSPDEIEAQGTRPKHREAPTLLLEGGITSGPLSDAEEASLEAVYGPSDELPISTMTRVEATIGVWLPIVASIALLTVAVFLLAARVKRRLNRKRAVGL